MDTGRHCAYNVTRNALLSERVTCVEESLDQPELMELVMNGPGLDRHSAVWVRKSPGWLDLPRLVAFDFAYLDDQQRILEAGVAGPGAGFPAIGEGVAGALILANRRLAETGAAAGDQVRICEQAELAALVKAASQTSVERPADPMQTGSEDRYAAHPVPFQVSRYSEFVFEPFGGSLVYLPPADAAAPQSSEYFLPDRAPANQENAAPEPAEVAGSEQLEWPRAAAATDESARISARRRKQARKKAAAPQEEPHFYTPKPIRFFDPAAAENPSETPDTQEIAARQSTQLPPELKAAILQIDEQLRREKKDLEKPEKEKSQPKERKRRSGKKPPKSPEEEGVEFAHPAWEELAEPTRPSEAMIASEADVVEKIFEEAEAAAETIVLRPAAKRAAPVSEPETEIVLEPVAREMSPVEEIAPEAIEPAEEISIAAEVAAEFVPFADEIPRLAEPAPPTPQAPEPIILAPVAAAIEPVVVVPPQTPIPEKPIAVAGAAPVPIEEQKPAKEKLSLGKRLQRWIGGQATDQRRGERSAMPGLVAFYWSGGAPRPHEIVNISRSGFYLRTKELWLADTLVRMTLQRSHQEPGSGKESISVLARVVRIDDDGVGHEFVMTDTLRHMRIRDVLPEHGTNAKELERFLKQGAGTRD